MPGQTVSRCGLSVAPIFHFSICGLVETKRMTGTFLLILGSKSFVKDLDNRHGETVIEDNDGTSVSLIRRLKKRRPEAWQRMAELYAPLVFRWCRRAQLQSADADDVVQEVFRTIDRRIEQFEHGSKDQTFRGWLRVITRHKLGDFFRKQKRSEKALGGTDGQLRTEAVAADDATIDEAVNAEFGEIYRRAMEFIRVEFKAASWDAFWRVVVDGCDAANVAEDLGISRNAVYVAKSRILSRLREELGDI